MDQHWLRVHFCVPLSVSSRGTEYGNPGIIEFGAAWLNGKLGTGDVGDCKSWAESVSGSPDKQVFGDHSYVTPQDAARHCLGSCCLAAKKGRLDALGLLQAREPDTPVSPRVDNAMDRNNNDVGASMGGILHSLKNLSDGQKKELCVLGCLAAMAVGDLLWVDRWWEGPNKDNLYKDDGPLKFTAVPAGRWYVHVETWGDNCPGLRSKKRKYPLVPSTYPPKGKPK